MDIGRGPCVVVAGVALVAENVHTQTLAAPVESNTENEFKVNIVLLFTDRYLPYPSTMSLGIVILFIGRSY